MTDKQIIDGERIFECVWCKYDFKESDANFILSENPNECVCSGCMTEWADNLLWDFKRKEQKCEELKETIDSLLKIQYQLANSCTKYEQTIAKIKEITEIEIECKTYEIENDCFNEIRCKALNEHIDFIKQILQKINECEVTNAR